MKYLKLFEQLKFSYDLPLELEYKIRTIDDDSELTIDDFFDEFEIDKKDRNNFMLGAIFKQKSERFDNMNDEEFFKLYREYENDKILHVGKKYNL